MQSVRVGSAVKQSTLLNLGSHFDLPKEVWPALARRIDELMPGQRPLLDATLSVLLPDGAPLITLACADALDLLMKPGWAVRLVDGVLHEVTRNITPTRQLIAPVGASASPAGAAAGKLPEGQHLRVPDVPEAA